MREHRFETALAERDQARSREYLEMIEEQERHENSLRALQEWAHNQLMEQDPEYQTWCDRMSEQAKAEREMTDMVRDRLAAMPDPF